jgi:multimeric flavodoxin WrbA
MASDGNVIGLVGSPNREGRTNQLVAAALEGAARQGVTTELIQMADHVVAACKDCLPWVCKDNLKCTYEDEAFEYLSLKILNCGALVLGTPVYWWDTSGLVKYLILKMFRIYARSAPLQGLPAFGVAIAGGTGNGLVSGLRPVYHFFQMMQMHAVEPVPATRFNFNGAVEQARKLGEKIAAMAGRRHPFADLAIQALPSRESSEMALGLARADELSAAGKPVEALTEITRVYEAGVKAFEEK